MDPIETWHDAPTFEAMEAKLKIANERIGQLEKGYDELRKINNRLLARIKKATK